MHQHNRWKAGNRLDGKALKGARAAGAEMAFLLAGLCQRTGWFLAQIGIRSKTSEVPGPRALLAALDIADR
ncbi:hypothetical protein OG563_07110 [Nocardia vinacea]|uniref:Uncharacterized protein n=1 Tax=Nocardia vinacea TaxID=96468 RepID=A0ABZ1Z1K9_9NOCA|nr:hypothetical protein [Nocardia vinacea]